MKSALERESASTRSSERPDAPDPLRPRVFGSNGVSALAIQLGGGSRGPYEKGEVEVAHRTSLYHPRRGLGSTMDLIVISRGSAVFGPSKGGADTLALRHARLMARQGLRVGFVGLPMESAEPRVTIEPIHQDDVLEYHAGRPRAIALAYMVNQLVRLVASTRLALRVIEKEQPQVVLSNASLTTILVRMRHPTIPIIYYLHDGLFAHRTARGVADRLVRFGWNDLMERIAVKFATHVFCASEGIASDLRLNHVPGAKLCVMVPAAPSAEEFSAAPEERPSGAIVSSIGHPFLLSVGQQSGRKRFDLLLESMTFLPADYHLVVVGDGPYHPEYVRIAKEAGITDRVHLLTEVTDAELRELYSAANLYVLVSENEGFPVTVTEALAAGCTSLLASPSACPPDGAEERLTLLNHIPTPGDLAAFIHDLWPLGAAARSTRSARSEAKREITAAARVDATISQHYLRLLSQWAVPGQRSLVATLSATAPMDPVEKRHESG